MRVASKSLPRRKFLWGLAAGSVGAALSPSPLLAKTLSSRTGPNFVVILVDDLGYGDLGCYGNTLTHSPNLDRLAAQGLRLTDCYAAAPVCSPARASLLTGRNANRCGIYGHINPYCEMHLTLKEVTVAKLLQGAGYETFMAGKWHLNSRFNTPHEPKPDEHGFAYWMANPSYHEPSMRDPIDFVRNGLRLGKLEGYSCDIVTDEAVYWLKHERDERKPFFMYICYNETHEPIKSPPHMVDLYPVVPTIGEALYRANVTNLDQAVGRLVDQIDRMGLGDNTLVFFTSDNGPEDLGRHPQAWRSYGSAGPLREEKLYLYEGGIRVPGILRWTGRIGAGVTSNEPISGVDVLPSLCELAGIPVPSDRPIDGANFVPIFEGEPVQRETPLFWYYFNALGKARTALRIGPWKILGLIDQPKNLRKWPIAEGHMEIIRNAEISGFELYNLQEDIGETRNLAAKESHRLSAMAELLIKLHREVRTEGPDWPVAQAPDFRD